MTRLRIVVVISLAAVGACSQGSREVDTATDEAAIAQVREREVTALNGSQPDSQLAVLTEDAVMMPPDQPEVRGREALRSWAQGMMDRFTVSGRYTGADVVVAGDWAFERYTGMMTLTPRAGGTPIVNRVKGIHVYQRQPDGTWLIARDVLNNDPAQPASPAPPRP